MLPPTLRLRQMNKLIDDMGDDDEVALQAWRRLQEKAEGGTLDERWPQHRGCSLHSPQVPKSAPPVRNPPSPPNTSAFPSRRSNPESPQPYTPIPLPLPLGAKVLAPSLATYSPGKVLIAIHERQDGLTYVPGALIYTPTPLPLPLLIL